MIFHEVTASIYKKVLVNRSTSPIRTTNYLGSYFNTKKRMINTLWNDWLNLIKDNNTKGNKRRGHPNFHPSEIHRDNIILDAAELQKKLLNLVLDKL